MVRTTKRDEVWQRKVVERERSALRTWLASLAKPERTESLQKALRGYRRDRSYLAQLKTVLIATELIRQESDNISADRKAIEGLKDLGERLLEQNRVRPRKSRLAFLYADLQEAMAEWEVSRGRSWTASWRRQLARELGGTAFSAKEDIEQACHSLRCGDVAEAIRVLESLSPTPQSAQLEITCLRLTGDIFRAQALLNEARVKFPDDRQVWQWQARLCECQLSGSPEGLFEIARRDSLAQQAELSLWCLGSMSREWMDRRPSVVSLRKISAGPMSAARTVLVEAVEVFEQAYDGSQPLARRLQRLGELLSRGETLAEIEQELLLAAAAARWLHRIRQRALCSQALARYRSLSLSLSGGATADTLGLLADVLEERNSGYQQSIRTGSLGRSLSLGSLSLEIMAAVGRRRLGQLFGAGLLTARLKETEAEAIALIATRHLSALKGPLMKVGQTASYFGLELPPLSVEILSRLQDDSQPLAPKLIRDILQAEFGVSVEKKFGSFVDQPIGVGSIGQVHSAVLPSGREVAVKIRYPGIEQAIESDVFLLRILLPVIRLLNAQSIPQETLDELRLRLLEECDYRREASLQQAFRRKFTQTHIYVPEVIESHCSDRVLTSELVQGMSLGEFKRQATTDERNRMGELVMEFVLGSCRDGMFNADPHPGNFLFQRDTLIALDFGSVKIWRTEAARHWADLCRAGVQKNYELFKVAIQNMGLVGNARNFDFRAYYEIFVGGCMGETAVPAERRFERRVLHQELRSLFGNANPNQRHTYYNPNYLYGIRVYSGLISLLAELESHCNYHVCCSNILETKPREDFKPPGKTKKNTPRSEAPLSA